jgi:hypothetical protein
VAVPVGRSLAAQRVSGESPRSFALCDGLIRLDDRVADMIREWRSDPRKWQITIRQLLNFTDGIEEASRLRRDSIVGRGCVAIGVHLWAESFSDFLGTAAPETKRALIPVRRSFLGEPQLLVDRVTGAVDLPDSSRSV